MQHFKLIQNYFCSRFSTKTFEQKIHHSCISVSNGREEGMSTKDVTDAVTTSWAESISPSG